jgi:hypothetical protein
MNILENFRNDDVRTQGSHNIIEKAIFEYDIKIVLLSILDNCILYIINYNSSYRPTRILSYIEELNIGHLKNDIYWNTTLLEKEEMLNTCKKYAGTENIEEKFKESISKLRSLITLNELQK